MQSRISLQRVLRSLPLHEAPGGKGTFFGFGSVPVARAAGGAAALATPPPAAAAPRGAGSDVAGRPAPAPPGASPPARTELRVVLDVVAGLAFADGADPAPQIAVYLTFFS